jgi:hypothetical protein
MGTLGGTTGSSAIVPALDLHAPYSVHVFVCNILRALAQVASLSISHRRMQSVAKDCQPPYATFLQITRGDLYLEPGSAFESLDLQDLAKATLLLAVAMATSASTAGHTHMQSRRRTGGAPEVVESKTCENPRVPVTLL